MTLKYNGKYYMQVTATSYDEVAPTAAYLSPLSSQEEQMYLAALQAAQAQDAALREISMEGASILDVFAAALQPAARSHQVEVEQRMADLHMRYTAYDRLRTALLG